MTPRLDLPGLAGDAKAAALEGIRSVLTEENTDKLIELLERELAKVLPWWARFLPIGVVLDRLLPDILLRVFEDALG